MRAHLGRDGQTAAFSFAETSRTALVFVRTAPARRARRTGANTAIVSPDTVTINQPKIRQGFTGVNVPLTNVRYGS
jgi:hypothetical protein